MSVRNPVELADTLADQIRSATVQHRDAQETAEAKAKIWRELIVQAVDTGAKVKDVATAAGVSSARIHAVVVREYSRP